MKLPFHNRRPHILFAAIALVSTNFPANAQKLITSQSKPSDYSPVNIDQLIESAKDIQAAIQSGDIQRQVAAMNRNSALIHQGTPVSSPGRVDIIPVPESVSTTRSVKSSVGRMGAGAGASSSNRRPGLPSSQPIILTQCQSITSPGIYIVNQALANTNGCLQIHDTHDIDIECDPSGQISTDPADHAVAVTNVNGLTINGCTIPGTIYSAVTINKSSRVRITNSHLGWIDVNNSKQSSIINNVIDGYYQQHNSSYMTIQGNTIKTSANEISSAGIITANGSHNLFRDNSVDGSWNGQIDQTTKTGADDGIILQDESWDQIVGNQFANTWDAGIETSGIFNHSTVANNVIRNTSVGIASYYNTSWTGTTVSNNKVQNAYMLLDLVYTPNSTGTQSDTVNFKDNLFEGNELTDPLPSSGSYSPSMVIDFSTGLNGRALAVGKNVMSNNNFGSKSQLPIINPQGAIVDGGGNKCAAGQNSETCIGVNLL